MDAPVANSGQLVKDPDMRWLYKYVVFPGVRIFFGRNYGRQLSDLLMSQQWTPEELREFQEMKLRRLIDHCYVNVPFYKHVFDENKIKPGEIRTISDLKALPVMTKQTMSENSDDLLARNYSKKLMETETTSGSTGKPTRFYFDLTSRDIRKASQMRSFMWAGQQFGDKLLLVKSFMDQKKTFYRRLSDIATRSQRLDAYDLTDKTLIDHVERIRKLKPKIVYGYAKALFFLSRLLNQLNCNDLGVESVISSGEMLLETERKEVEKAFRCKVFNLYGSVEAYSIGMECKAHDGLHISSDLYIYELTKNGETINGEGEEGEVTITNLNNYAMPFVRYNIEDLAELKTTERCQCGCFFPRIELTGGRKGDVLQGTNGNKLSCMFFSGVFRQFEDQIRQYQVIQSEADHLKMNVVRTASYREQTTNQLIQRVCEKAGSEMRVEINFVPVIHPTKSGKLRTTISLLDKAAEHL